MGVRIVRRPHRCGPCPYPAADRRASTAGGKAENSPGFLSGNMVNIPVHIPVNLCGNTVNVIGALNPAFGNHCENQG